MRTDAAPSLVRRTLFVGEWLQIGHIAVRPESSECGEVETSDFNVLALPLAGLFAKHDGPRRHAIATPSHALLISAGKPYRLSFPGCIGDRCLALRLTSDGTGARGAGRHGGRRLRRGTLRQPCAAAARTDAGTQPAMA